MEISEVKTMKIEELQRAPYNPRLITPENRKALRKSMERFGLVENLVWNKRTGNLVGGHQRLAVLQEQGVEEVPVAVVDLPEEEEKALNITLNNKATQGSFEAAKLQKQLAEIANVLPSAFDELNMWKLQAQEEENFVEEKEQRTGIGDGEHPEIEIQPYESYDYLVFFYKDQRNFVRDAQILGVQDVDSSSVSGKKKIGLGRCLLGERLSELLIGD
jgi:hypothetical protein